MIFYWARLAYIDYVWCFYELLAFYGFLRWSESRRISWLALTGICIGFALGSKYLAVWSFVLIAGFILITLIRQSIKNIVRSLLIYVVFAALVGSVWYLKNLFLAGNPVYPLAFGGPGWDPERVQVSFGNPRTISGWFRIIPDMYLNIDRFGTFALEMPGLLFPLALLYIFLPKTRNLSIMSIYAGLYFLLWTTGSQQVRFLMPIFPQISIITAVVLNVISQKLKTPKIQKLLVPALLLSMAIITSMIQAYLYFSYPSLPVVLGSISKQSYLASLPGNYTAIEFIMDNLPKESRVMMLWDGRGYYCDSRCLPDADQSNWVRLVDSFSTARELSRALRAQGITHLLYSKIDLDSLLKHDPQGLHRKANEFFLEYYAGHCAVEVFANATHELYDIRPCLPSSSLLETTSPVARSMLLLNEVPAWGVPVSPTTD
jgi:hypothetical protein